MYRKICILIFVCFGGVQIFYRVRYDCTFWSSIVYFWVQFGFSRYLNTMRLVFFFGIIGCGAWIYRIGKMSFVDGNLNCYSCFCNAQKRWILAICLSNCYCVIYYHWIVLILFRFEFKSLLAATFWEICKYKKWDYQ